MLYNFIIKMSLQQKMNIQQMYSTINHLGEGIRGYQIHKSYIDPIKIIQDRQIVKIKKGQKNNKYVTRRGNYLDDQIKNSKTMPGPQKYPVNMQWPQLSKRLKVNHPDRNTYIDQIFKLAKKDKRPAPGSYKITKSLQQQELEKKKLATKRIQSADRSTFLDGIQHSSSLTPGTGSYNPRQRTKTEISHLKTNPQDWRKRHNEEKSKNTCKSPSAASYRPKPADFTLFQNMFINSSKKKRNGFSRAIRFKTSPSKEKISPATYSVIQTWRGKSKEKIERHGMQVLSVKSMHKTIYYN